jgi:hypothetical protein
MNEPRARAHLRRLLRIAAEAQVDVHFLASHGLEWNGLYIFDREWGAGIAVNAALSLDWLVWAFAHELGHHFGGSYGHLFPPFAEASKTGKRPCRSRVADSEEISANHWAAQTLIDSAEWARAEDLTPLSLSSISNALGLPLAAAIAWERARRARADARRAVRVPVDPRTAVILANSAVGRGGHQSLFGRVAPNHRARQLNVSFSDFSLARIRVIEVKGGWLPVYRGFLAAMLPAIQRAGGVGPLFGLAELRSPI